LHLHPHSIEGKTLIRNLNRQAFLWLTCCIAIPSTSNAQGQASATPLPHQQPIGEPTPAKPTTESTKPDDAVDRLLTTIALNNMPREFSETKDWGGQEERWDGLEIERDGLKIETRRRRKLVNHGTWKKYSASLRNPEEEFQIQIKNMHETTSGKLAFEIHLAAHLNIDTRQAKWVKGVQLYSVNAVGHAAVRLVIAIEMGVKMGISKFPPDLILAPSATSADLIIDEFRIDRISKIGGEIAQQISDNVQAKLDEKIVEKEAKLLTKINGLLIKSQDDFRLSIADVMKSRWGDSLTGVIPENTSSE
jgi:hypothetical protein